MEIRKFKSFYAGNQRLCTLMFELGDGFKAYGFGLQFFGEDNTLQISLHWHWSLYVSIEIPKINRIVKEYENGWQIGAHFFGTTLTINMPTNKDDRAWLYWDWFQALKGRAVHTQRTLSCGGCEIILPEYRYPGDYEVIERTITFPRWFTKRYTTISVNVPEGIPVPGKGENSWDCGDDKIFSVSSDFDWHNENMSIRHALQDLAMTVLKRRVKYASLDWKPRDEDVENIVDAYEKHGKNPVCGATDQALGVEK